jgi:ABC-type uncharacterized transport system permease subunit
MNSEPAILLHAAAGGLYAALALYFWKTRWRSTANRRHSLSAAERIALVVPVTIQAFLIFGDILIQVAPRFGFAHALAAMTWLAVLIYWIENFFYEVDGMLPPVLLTAAVVAPLPAIFPGLTSLNSTSVEFRMHLVLAMVAYSLFALAILHALLMATLERRLHRPERSALLSDSGELGRLPPLLTLERLLFRLIGAAFIALTATLATGIAFSESLFGRALNFDHKTLFALLSWATFAVLLAGRAFHGWRGRVALRWTLTGFGFLMLAYIGSRFVLEVVLRRATLP